MTLRGKNHKAYHVNIMRYYIYIYIRTEGKNQSVCVCVQSISHVQLFETLWAVACQPPVATGFSGQKYWSGLSFPPPGHLPDPETEPTSPTLAGDSL